MTVAEEQEEKSTSYRLIFLLCEKLPTFLLTQFFLCLFWVWGVSYFCKIFCVVYQSAFLKSFLNMLLSFFCPLSTSSRAFRKLFSVCKVLLWHLANNTPSFVLAGCLVSITLAGVALFHLCRIHITLHISNHCTQTVSQSVVVRLWNLLLMLVDCLLFFSILNICTAGVLKVGMFHPFQCCAAEMRLQDISELLYLVNTYWGISNIFALNIFWETHFVPIRRILHMHGGK